ncbi:MAG TPA: hypothetical protein VK852_12590 [Desulfobacterales bacterium]|jgi:hypothetical protein|nr:hypothetical protein [Desulfobacterales bacterium]
MPKTIKLAAIIYRTPPDFARVSVAGGKRAQFLALAPPNCSDLTR